MANSVHGPQFLAPNRFLLHATALALDPTVKIGYQPSCRFASVKENGACSDYPRYICGGADYATGKASDKIVQVVP